MAKLTAQTMDPKVLWKSKKPWTIRPLPIAQALWYSTLGGAAVEKLARPVAKGYRPPRPFWDMEWAATLVGGLQALSEAGVPGYEKYLNAVRDFELPISRIRKNPAIESLVKAVGKKSLRKAAEKIQKVVAKKGLSEAAWFKRAALLLRLPITSAKVRAAAAGVATAALSTTPYVLIPMAIGAGESVSISTLEKEKNAYEQLASGYIKKWVAENRARMLAAESARQGATYEAEDSGSGISFPVIAGVIGSVAIIGIIGAVALAASRES